MQNFAYIRQLPNLAKASLFDLSLLFDLLVRMSCRTCLDSLPARETASNLSDSSALKEVNFVATADLTLRPLIEVFYLSNNFKSLNQTYFLRLLCVEPFCLQ